MTLLIVTPRFPYPTRTGDTLTVFHLLKYFSQRHVIDMVSCTNQIPGAADIDAVAPYCRKIVPVPISRIRRSANALGSVLGSRPLQADWFYSPAVARIVDDLVQQNRYDVLYAHTIRAARYLTTPQGGPAALRVLAMQISMQLNYRRIASFERNPFYRLVFNYEAARLAAYEPEIASSFDHALVISDVDREAIGGNNDGRFFECPHGVSLDHTPVHATQREPNSMVFSGNMNYRPNVDAALFFVREIFPLVRQRVPEAVLYIVGANPAQAVQALGETEGVVVTGEVESVYAWLRRVAVGVNPLRAGAGLQNKVLEGLACGLPMVITSVANEGIRATPGAHVLVADSISAFAENVVNLLVNREFRHTLGGRARQFIEHHWSWDVHFRRLERFLEDRVGRMRVKAAQ